MSGIQILLSAGILIIFLYFASRVANAFVSLLFFGFFSGLALFFILFPDYTNVVASRLGVGRGADLVFYICILLFLFVVVKLFARIRKLEAGLTQLVRELAKRSAQGGDNDQ